MLDPSEKDPLKSCVLRAVQVAAVWCGSNGVTGLVRRWRLVPCTACAATLAHHVDPSRCATSLQPPATKSVCNAVQGHGALPLAIASLGVLLGRPNGSNPGSTRSLLAL